jgi:hypothetical protein
MSADGFYNLAAFLRRKLKINFLLDSMNPLTTSENPSSNFLQKACSGFQVAACDSKSCSEIHLCVLKNVIAQL